MGESGEKAEFDGGDLSSEIAASQQMGFAWGGAEVGERERLGKGLRFASLEQLERFVVLRFDGGVGVLWKRFAGLFGGVELGLPFGHRMAVAERGVEGSEGDESAIAAVERFEHAIVILAGDRVVFVIVASNASEGEAEHGGPGGGEHVIELVEPGPSSFLFHEIGGQFGVGAGDDETGSGDRFGVVGFEFIARKLPAKKGVEGHVLIEGADHEIAEVMSGGSIGIAFLSVAIGVASDIQPVSSPALAVVRTGEQFVDQRSDGELGIARVRLDERSGLLWSWREADEIEVESAD